MLYGEGLGVFERERSNLGSDFRREARIVVVENSLSEEANTTFGTREIVLTIIG